MVITKDDIPILLKHLWYGGSMDLDNIQKWLSNKFNIHIHIQENYTKIEKVEYWIATKQDNDTIKFTRESKTESKPTGYYWYDISVIEYYDKKKNKKLYSQSQINLLLPYECHHMYSGEPDGDCFDSYSMAQEAAIIRCLMYVICGKDIFCKSTGHYAVDVLTKNIEQISCVDYTTLEELFSLLTDLNQK